MIFVGGGSLLSQAVGHALSTDRDVELVCCPVDDAALPKLRRLGVGLLTSNNPSVDLLERCRSAGSSFVMSINNKFLLTDTLLSSGPRFYNIHSGLVQRYRGLAEVCVFAALCVEEPDYGVTLHRILPGQKVDSGPVVDQLRFAVRDAGATFSGVMDRALAACQAVFEANLPALVEGRAEERYVPLDGAEYYYRDLPRIVEQASETGLVGAVELGSYRRFFPRLAAKIDELVVGRSASATNL